MSEVGEIPQATSSPSVNPQQEGLQTHEQTAGISRMRGMLSALEKYQTIAPQSAQLAPFFGALHRYVTRVTVDPDFQRLLTQMEQRHDPQAAFRYGESFDFARELERVEWTTHGWEKDASSNRPKQWDTIADERLERIHRRRDTYEAEKASLTSELVRRLDRPGFSYESALRVFVAQALGNGLTDADITSRILFAMNTYRINTLLRDTLASAYRTHQIRAFNLLPVFQKSVGAILDPDRQHILDDRHAGRCTEEHPDVAYFAVTGQSPTGNITSTLGNGYISFHLEKPEDADQFMDQLDASGSSRLSAGSGKASKWPQHSHLELMIAFDTEVDPDISAGTQLHEVIHITNDRLHCSIDKAQKFLGVNHSIFSRPENEIPPSAFAAFRQDMADFKRNVIDYHTADEIIAEAATPIRKKSPRLDYDTADEIATEPATPTGGRSTRQWLLDCLQQPREEGGGYDFPKEWQPHMNGCLFTHYRDRYAAGQSGYGKNISDAYGILMVELEDFEQSHIYQEAYKTVFDRQKDKEAKRLAITSAYNLADTGMDPTQLAVVFEGVPLEEWPAIANRLVPRPPASGEPELPDYPEWFQAGREMKLIPFPHQLDKWHMLLPGQSNEWILSGDIREGGYILINVDTAEERIFTYGELKNTVFSWKEPVKTR